jgi:hypothetical protein
MGTFMGVGKFMGLGKLVGGELAGTLARHVAIVSQLATGLEPYSQVRNRLVQRVFGAGTVVGQEQSTGSSTHLPRSRALAPSSNGTHPC